jgi:hypothetical protein
MKFDLIKLRDAADWWVPDVRISEQYVCYLNFIFVPRECWLLGYFEPATKIRTIRWIDAAEWWVPDVRPSEKEMCDLLDLLFCSP